MTTLPEGSAAGRQRWLAAGTASGRNADRPPDTGWLDAGTRSVHRARTSRSPSPQVPGRPPASATLVCPGVPCAEKQKRRSLQMRLISATLKRVAEWPIDEPKRCSWFTGEAWRLMWECHGRVRGGGWRRMYGMPRRDLQALEWLSILRSVPVRQVFDGGWCTHARCVGWCYSEDPAAIPPKQEWCTHIGTDTVCAAKGEVNCSGTGRSVCTLFRVDGDDDPVLIPRPPFFHRLSRLLSPPRQPAGTLLPSYPLDSPAPLVARAPTTREQQGGGILLLSSDAVRPTCSRREQVRCAPLQCQPVRYTSRGATQRWHCLQAACHIRATLGSVSATVGLWNERAREIQMEK